MCVVGTFETRMCIQATTLDIFRQKEKNSYKSGWIFTILMSLESNFSEVIPAAAIQNFLHFFLLLSESMPWFSPRNNIYTRKMLLLIIFPKPLSTKSSFRSCFLLGFSLSHLLIEENYFNTKTKQSQLRNIVAEWLVLGLKIVVSPAEPLTCTDAWIKIPFSSILLIQRTYGPRAHT